MTEQLNVVRAGMGTPPTDSAGRNKPDMIEI